MFFSTRNDSSRRGRGRAVVAGCPLTECISREDAGVILRLSALRHGANQSGDSCRRPSSGRRTCFPEVVAVRTMRPSSMTMNDDSRRADGNGGVEKAEATPQSDAASLAWNQMTPCGLWRFRSSSVSNAANCRVVTSSRKCPATISPESSRRRSAGKSDRQLNSGLPCPEAP